MSRVHDALRRAEQAPITSAAPPPAAPPPVSDSAAVPPAPIAAAVAPAAPVAPGTVYLPPDLLARVPQVPFSPARDAHLVDASQPHEAPSEEFRSLRTRLNHLKTLQPIHSLVVTSPSPAEGKSFAAANLAISQSQLEGNRTLLIDCDFRRPIMHNLFQIDRAPGMTDFLMGKAPIEQVIRRIENTNLYIIPAGDAVINPLELLNLREMKLLIDGLPRFFNWIVLDSPPMLFAADANLLSTLCSGTVLVVRMGATTIDSVTRAMQSVCENNVIGTIVNGARRGELYSKYTYYHSYYYSKPQEPKAETPEEETAATL